jgi:hypothetical protein
VIHDVEDDPHVRRFGNRPHRTCQAVVLRDERREKNCAALLFEQELAGS